MQPQLRQMPPSSFFSTIAVLRTKLRRANGSHITTGSRTDYNYVKFSLCHFENSSKSPQTPHRTCRASLSSLKKEKPEKTDCPGADRAIGATGKVRRPSGLDQHAHRVFDVTLECFEQLSAQSTIHGAVVGRQGNGHHGRNLDFVTVDHRTFSHQHPRPEWSNAVGSPRQRSS